MTFTGADSWDALFEHDVMWSMIARLSAILLIWFVAGPIYVTLFKFEPAESPAVAPAQPVAAHVAPAQPVATRPASTSPSRDVSTFPRE
ncbi:hypothetical protein [Glaciibacter superstes]|uniref:hypothetical protein n=1 Tax=Glaciibacter superstes TaxID=501023 RepID=UPI0003B74201|nr:hypothetical protein [Glaciibacter superstes]